MIELAFGGRRVPVTAAELVIGSNPQAGLLVEGSGVLPAHAAVRIGPGGTAVLTPAQPGALLLINGQRVGAASAELAAGDRIGIGDQEVVVLDPSAPAGAPQRLNNTMMGMPALPSAARAEFSASPPAAAPAAAGTSPARRLALLGIGVAVAAAIVYLLLFRS